MENVIEKIKSDKKMLVIIIVGLIGAVLLVFFGNETESEPDNSKNEITSATLSLNTSTEIEDALAKKLEDIISGVQGAGEVVASVSVGSASEYIYAKNEKTDGDSDSSSHDSEIVIYENENGNDSGLVVSIKNPEIIGVAVICEGGESAVVKAEITNLVTSLLGIGADRVYVGKKV